MNKFFKNTFSFKKTLGKICRIGKKKRETSSRRTTKSTSSLRFSGRNLPESWYLRRLRRRLLLRLSRWILRGPLLINGFTSELVWFSWSQSCLCFSSTKRRRRRPNSLFRQHQQTIRHHIWSQIRHRVLNSLQVPRASNKINGDDARWSKETSLPLRSVSWRSWTIPTSSVSRRTDRSERDWLHSSNKKKALTWRQRVEICREALGNSPTTSSLIHSLSSFAFLFVWCTKL